MGNGQGGVSEAAGPAELTRRMLDFVADIGLVWEQATLDEPTLLPGLAIRDGRLLVDVARLAYPGDILHEAGHLAVTPAAERPALGPARLGDAGLEMAAIAWSYAACVHLEIPPETVFHEHGYKGGAAQILATLQSGGMIGQPLLDWMGMTRFGRGAEGPGTFPQMLRWLRD